MTYRREETTYPVLIADIIKIRYCVRHLSARPESFRFVQGISTKQVITEKEKLKLDKIFHKTKRRVA